MTENYVDAVFSFFALACLIGLFYSAWQSLIVDAVRQRMFDIRDKVFLWAFDNGRLNDLAYKEFREAANAAIRHFENVSLLKLIVMNSLFDIKKQTSSPKNIFLQDSHLKDEFHKLTKVAVRGLMARSLLIMVPLLFMLPMLILLSLLDNRKSLIPNRMTRTLSRGLEADILMETPCLATHFA